MAAFAAILASVLIAARGAASISGVAFAPTGASAIATDTASPTLTSTPTEFATPTPTTLPPTPEPIARGLQPAPPPAVIEPEPTPVRGGTVLPMPDGTSVVWGGCASDGECHWFNFYWAPTREVVMQPGEGQHKVQHELCHAHQHWSINGGSPLAPSDYDLESWYETTEGASFTAAVTGLSWPWTHSHVNGLEDFAWTCAYWYLDAAYLLDVSPERYRWAAANLP